MLLPKFCGILYLLHVLCLSYRLYLHTVSERCYTLGDYAVSGFQALCDNIRLAVVLRIDLYLCVFDLVILSYELDEFLVLYL